MPNGFAIQIILESANFTAFMREVKNDRSSALAARLDGFNPFSAAIVANAPIKKRMSLLLKLADSLLENRSLVTGYLFLPAKVSRPSNPVPYADIPFLLALRHLDGPDITFVLTALADDFGVAFSNDQRKAIERELRPKGVDWANKLKANDNAKLVRE